MKKALQLLLVALFLLTQAATIFAARPPIMPKKSLPKAKSVPKTEKGANDTKAQSKDTRTQSEKAADYRKQQGLDVRSARPKNGDVKGAQKREDADEAAEAARAKGFNARTSTPVDKSKSKVERMTGSKPANIGDINSQNKVVKINPANPSNTGKKPSIAPAKPNLKTSTPVDKSKSKSERLTGDDAKTIAKTKIKNNNETTANTKPDAITNPKGVNLPKTAKLTEAERNAVLQKNIAKSKKENEKLISKEPKPAKPARTKNQETLNKNRSPSEQKEN